MAEKRNMNNQVGERALFLYCTLTDHRAQAAREDARSPLGPPDTPYTRSVAALYVIIGLETGR